VKRLDFYNCKNQSKDCTQNHILLHRQKKLLVTNQYTSASLLPT